MGKTGQAWGGSERPHAESPAGLHRGTSGTHRIDQPEDSGVAGEGH